MKHTFLRLFQSILIIILININCFHEALSMQANKLTAEENAKLNARYIKLHRNVKNFVAFSKFQSMSEHDRKDAEDRSAYEYSFLHHNISFDDWNALTANQKKNRVEEKLDQLVGSNEFSLKTAEYEFNRICNFIKNRSFPRPFKSYNEYVGFFRLEWHMSPYEYMCKLREILIKKGVIINSPLKVESGPIRIGR